MRPNVRLGDLVQVQRGQSYKSAFIGEPGPYLLGLGAIQRNGGFRGDNLRTYGGPTPGNIRLRPGDLFASLKDVTHAADLLGAVARVPDSVEGSRLTQDTVRLDIVDDGVDVDFLYWHLRSPAYRAYCKTRGTGTTNLDLSREQFFAYEFWLPRRSEQQAIAEVLGALDDKIAANTHLAATADELAKLLYAAGVRRLPRVAMSSLLSPVLGGTPARSRSEFWDGEELWISAKDVTGAPDHVVLDTEQKITELAVQQTKAKPLPRGSVILTARGTVGAVARLGRPASFNQSCYGFEPVALPPAVLYFAILAATDQAKAIAHGSVFDTITMKTFDYLTLPEFGVGEAAALEAGLAPLLDSVEAAVVENRRLESIRDTVLPQLMSGKLRVREAAEMAGL